MTSMVGCKSPQPGPLSSLQGSRRDGAPRVPGAMSGTFSSQTVEGEEAHICPHHSSFSTAPSRKLLSDQHPAGMIDAPSDSGHQS